MGDRRVGSAAVHTCSLRSRQSATAAALQRSLLYKPHNDGAIEHQRVKTLLTSIRLIRARSTDKVKHLHSITKVLEIYGLATSNLVYNLGLGVAY